MKKVTDPGLILQSHTLQAANKKKFSQHQSIQLFPIKPSHPLEAQKPKIPTSLKQLEAQADKINQLSAKLEAAIREFKAIATQVNQDRLLRSKRRDGKPDQICEYREAVVPVVRQKSSGRFVLMSRSVLNK